MVRDESSHHCAIPAPHPLHFSTIFFQFNIFNWRADWKWGTIKWWFGLKNLDDSHWLTQSTCSNLNGLSQSRWNVIVIYLFNVNNMRECLRNLPSRWLVIMCLTIIQIELEFGNVGFYEGTKTGVPGEKPSEQRREPTTNSTHIWRRDRESNPGHIGERPAWEANAQPLRHPPPRVARKFCGLAIFCGLQGQIFAVLDVWNFCWELSFAILFCRRNLNIVRYLESQFTLLTYKRHYCNTLQYRMYLSSGFFLQWKIMFISPVAQVY